ncbi:hypothetical protein HDU76_011804, partial [Blyttiomyces sp. JEL0837]
TPAPSKAVVGSPLGSCSSSSSMNTSKTINNSKGATHPTPAIPTASPTHVQVFTHLLSRHKRRTKKCKSLTLIAIFTLILCVTTFLLLNDMMTPLSNSPELGYPYSTFNNNNNLSNKTSTKNPNIQGLPSRIGLPPPLNESTDLTFKWKCSSTDRSQIESGQSHRVCHSLVRGQNHVFRIKDSNVCVPEASVDVDYWMESAHWMAPKAAPMTVRNRNW